MYRKLLILLFATSITMISATYGFGHTITDKTEFDPSILKIKEDDYLGKIVPDIEMKDEGDRFFRLSEYTDKTNTPVILSLVYYSCPNVCKALNDGLAEALNSIGGLILGKDYNVITLSFDKNDKPEDAIRFHERLKKSATLPKNAKNWVFATATEKEIKRLTEAVGYRFFYSIEDKSFVHPTVYIFLSPKRKITRYIFGLYPRAFDVKLAILESMKGKTGKVPILTSAVLACFKYDPALGGYKLNLPFIFGMIGLSFGAFTSIIVFLFSRKMKRQNGLYRTNPSG